MTPYIVLASTTDSGAQVTDTPFIIKADISPNGKYLAFLTSSQTLEPGTPPDNFGPTIGYWFIKNLQTGALVRVPGETFFPGDPSFQPNIFQNNYEVVIDNGVGVVTYASYAASFDLDTGAILSVHPVPQDPTSSFAPTARVFGGTSLVFGENKSFNLTTGTLNERFAEISVTDTQTNAVTVERMPIHYFAGGAFGPITATFSESATPVAASLDGRYVALSISNVAVKNLNPGFFGGTIALDVGVYDMVNHSFVRFTDTSAAAVAGFSAATPFLDTSTLGTTTYDITNNGRYVLISTAMALGVGDTNGKGDVYLADATTGKMTRLSLGPGGTQLTGDSLGAAISGNGRFVAFYSDASELGASGQFFSDVYVLDRNTGQILQVNITTDGTDGYVSRRAIDITPDGRFITFFSADTHYVAGDLNGREDVFSAANPFLADKIPTPGDDTLNGGGGDDRIDASGGNDLVKGLSGNDDLTGGSGKDSLLGGLGDDTLAGGTGRDQLTGTGGVDVFLFAAASHAGLSVAGADRITDFSSAEGDQIDLHLIDAKPASGIDDAFAWRGTLLFTGKAGQLRYDTATGTIQGDLDGDGTADFFIRVNVAPGASDIVL